MTKSRRKRSRHRFPRVYKPAATPGPRQRADSAASAQTPPPPLPPPSNRAGALPSGAARGACACARLETRFAEIGDGGGRGNFAAAGGFGTAGGAACPRAGEHRAEAAAGADAAPGPAGGPALPGDGGCGYRRFGSWRRCPLPLLGDRVPGPLCGASPLASARTPSRCPGSGRPLGSCRSEQSRPTGRFRGRTRPPDSQPRAGLAASGLPSLPPARGP